MKERLIAFLNNENKSSAQLAEEIGVQASGISHILSGRNNPSLDFVLKMLEKYQFLSTDWLLFGKGSMYKESKMQNLFDYESVNISENDVRKVTNETLKQEMPIQERIKGKLTDDSVFPSAGSASDVVKIVWFYNNNSFEEFYPHK